MTPTATVEVPVRVLMDAVEELAVLVSTLEGLGYVGTAELVQKRIDGLTFFIPQKTADLSHWISHPVTVDDALAQLSARLEARS